MRFAAVFIVCSTAIAGAASRTVTDPQPDERRTSPTGKMAGDIRDDNALAMKMIWCPAGSFAKESDSADRLVVISNGFWLGKFEVTQAEWIRVMETKPWIGVPRVRIGDDVAATYVTWREALEFCEKLTIREREAGRLTAGWQYTLPTEAQWEFACRARTATIFSFGDDPAYLDGYAWYAPQRQSTSPAYRPERGQLRVGMKKPNPWGLHDMHGNVWEWCRDSFAITQPVGRDPEITAPERSRVIRGGSWWNGALECRSGRRDSQPRDRSNFATGFRVALSRTPAP